MSSDPRDPFPLFAPSPVIEGTRPPPSLFRGRGWSEELNSRISGGAIFIFIFASVGFRRVAGLINGSNTGSETETLGDVGVGGEVFYHRRTRDLHGS
ncbi:hypothetical protein CEXT_560991 [Caerostris extrusa]|uniref:Uncharacterized protein n=1 Tax=Caerostris extrusa TaxID=172846 RepID=A0AAV4NTM6_CAEEX|nr:hypothetical protein CEXT_560991 [Caerostris extrusa]